VKFTFKAFTCWVLKPNSVCSLGRINYGTINPNFVIIATGNRVFWKVNFLNLGADRVKKLRIFTLKISYFELKTAKILIVK
jgi:hypothetical protein